MLAATPLWRHPHPRLLPKLRECCRIVSARVVAWMDRRVAVPVECCGGPAHGALPAGLPVGRLGECHIGVSALRALSVSSITHAMGEKDLQPRVCARADDA